MDATDKYGVFIIETLKLKDEKKGNLDGQVLKDILDLCDIPNEYYYIRTRQELEEIIIEFEASEFRYLHFSCHANDSQIGFTFESLFFSEFEEIIGEYLNNKRVFMSACKASNFEFAKTLIPRTGCTSLIGSPDKINFDKSSVFWSSFYHLMNENDSDRMGQPEIKKVLQSLVNIHNIPINYYSFIRNNKKELNQNLIRPNKKIQRTRLAIK
ncbi:hypothetical protein MWU58_09605 [Flavobacteriaceae bacterium S0825]|uniref:hypothetical protein n=1 Tax=Gaetbulibacter sp. S0825 TaxID=2720084 RepID=UPI00142F7751|nr:hypothetical protein [Gaetbulibacter sp. S0825]MCK0109549.1 hypothetical protein [Flavobacteriaceae bacterium S0825]NIX65182.1 hypothetical protein [Gaetbulibacter sp. S0825]